MQMVSGTVLLFYWLTEQNIPIPPKPLPTKAKLVALGYIRSEALLAN